MSLRPSRRLTSMCAMAILSATVNGTTIAQTVISTSQTAVSVISNEGPRNNDMDPSNNASNTAHAKKYALPPPFTAQEFWAKVTMLLKQTNGYVTHKQFEKTFKVKMKSIVHEDGRGYSLMAGTDWYMDVEIIETNDKYKGLGSLGPAGITSQLMMSWPGNPFDDSRGGSETRTCVRAVDAIKALTDSGWRLTGKAEYVHAIPRSAMADNFSLGKNSLNLFHYDYPGPIKPSDDTCVNRLTVVGVP